MAVNRFPSLGTGLAAALAAATALAAGAVQARNLAEIQRSGELRICVAGSSSPFYRENGEAFARFLGVAAAVTALEDWDRQFHDDNGVTIKEQTYEAALLASGACDVFPNDLHLLDWRLTKMEMVPYYATRSVVLSHRELAPLLKRTADLAGWRAAVQEGTSYDHWLRQQNATEFADRPVILEHRPTAESIRMVAERKADFTVVGVEAAFRWARGEGRDLAVLFPVGAPTQVGWGVGRQSADLKVQLERFFELSRQTGSDLDRSWKSYYGVSLTDWIAVR